jgi:hypothetical protein
LDGDPDGLGNPRHHITCTLGSVYKRGVPASLRLFQCLAVDGMSPLKVSPLPVELQYKVIEFIGAGATLENWVRLEKECGGWTAGVDALFGEWLKSQPAGSRFCEVSSPSQAEVQFVVDHVQGRRL